MPVQMQVKELESPLDHQNFENPPAIEDQFEELPLACQLDGEFYDCDHETDTPSNYIQGRLLKAESNGVEIESFLSNGTEKNNYAEQESLKHEL